MKLDNFEKLFTVNGTTYILTKTGYCFMTTGAKNTKGEDMNKRIKRDEFNKAYDLYVAEGKKVLAQMNAKQHAANDFVEIAPKQVDDIVAAPKADPADEKAAMVATIKAEKKAKKHVKTLSKIVRDTIKANSGEAVKAALETPEAVRRFADEQGWDFTEEVAFADVDRATTMVTDGVIRALFGIRRRSRVDDVTVDGTVLTAKQADFLRHLSDTCFWEDGLNSTIWVDCLCDDIGGQFKNKPMTVGAMISTLCEKHLGERAIDRRDGRKCTTFSLTEEGKKVAAKLGLK